VTIELYPERLPLRHALDGLCAGRQMQLPAGPPDPPARAQLSAKPTVSSPVATADAAQRTWFHAIQARA
jgi:hypothetical protein